MTFTEKVNPFCICISYPESTFTRSGKPGHSLLIFRPPIRWLRSHPFYLNILAPGEATSQQKETIDLLRKTVMSDICGDIAGSIFSFWPKCLRIMEDSRVSSGYD